MTPDRAVRLAWRVAGVLAVLIAYGSLFPFDFAAMPAHSDAWSVFASDWGLPKSKGDILGNIALFLPFGWAVARALRPDMPLATRIATVLALSLALALPLQMAQIYLPSRTAALGDVSLNLVGAAFGVAMAGIAHGRLERRIEPLLSLPGLFLVLWLAWELIPFVPSLDWQGAKEAMKPLLQGRFDLGDALFHLAGALLAGEAIAALAPPRTAPLWFAGALGGVGVAKLIVVMQAVDLSVVAGFSLAYVTWWSLRRRSPNIRNAVVVGLLVAAYGVAALSPFSVADAPNTIRWLPFSALLEGSMLANAKGLAASVLVFAGIVGIARQNGGNAVGATLGVAFLALLTEAVQILIAGRTPDVTEPIVAMLSGTLAATWPNGSRAPGDLPRPAATHAEDAAAPRPRLSWKAWLARLVVTCVVIALPIAAILRLPGIPYNVVELFRADGAFPVLMVFALALLWVGAGSALISRYIAASPSRDTLLPALAFAAGLTSLLLLWLSVTQESLADIAGSNNLYWFVTNKDIWGTAARELFLFLEPARDAIAFLERCVRYAALYGPIVVGPALAFLVVDTYRTHRLTARRVTVWLATAGLYLWLCKAIAFDWSSTDNLNELIARDGPWGWGGGGYLYLLVALFSVNVAGLAAVPARPLPLAVTIVATLAAVPVGWWLLNQGLEANVEKYDLVFSGAQFLLGPDRKHVMSAEALFVRWSAVQLGGFLVSAAGARLARSLPAK